MHVCVHNYMHTPHSSSFWLIDNDKKRLWFHTHTHTPMYAYAHTHTHSLALTNMHACTHTCNHAYTHTHTHTHTHHTHTRGYMHTRVHTHAYSCHPLSEHCSLYFLNSLDRHYVLDDQTLVLACYSSTCTHTDYWMTRHWHWCVTLLHALSLIIEWLDIGIGALLFYMHFHWLLSD